MDIETIKIPGGEEIVLSKALNQQQPNPYYVGHYKNKGDIVVFVHEHPTEAEARKEFDIWRNAEVKGQYKTRYSGDRAKKHGN